jgi:O-methyltransferase involved in polyketide biosynthesis
VTERNTSQTAMGTAYMRAAHQLFDPAPRLLEDPLAITLIGETGVQQIKAAADRYLSPPAAALRSHVVLRTRHTEQRLQAALERGVTQYVILGAGLDTFALRQPDWAQGLDIIEVDHPATQAVKLSMLARMTASLGEPWLSFFTPAAVEEKLRKAGFSTVEFLTPEAAAIHYFTSTTGSLPVPRQTNIVSAVI